MLRLIELNYHCHWEFSTPSEVIEKHRLTSGFIHFIKQKTKLSFVKHLNYEGEAEVEGIPYHFFKSRNRFWYIPFKTHRFIEKERPDVILVQGFVFVLQVMALRWKVGRKCLILVQHHGEKPFSGIKGFLQKICGRSIDGWLFTSIGNAQPWLDKKIIRNIDQCHEVLSASTDFISIDKTKSKAKLGFTGNDNFLWVGRLNENKDPLTVLKAFARLCTTHAQSRLYLIYQTEELLDEIKILISHNDTLQKAVSLVGQIEHSEIQDWYNASDFFISASHREGSGYALVEAMTCGCIPLVTDIPSFRKITADGKYGLLYQPGNADELYEKLLQLESIDTQKFSAVVSNYGLNDLSFKAVAEQMYDLFLKFGAK